MIVTSLFIEYFEALPLALKLKYLFHCASKQKGVRKFLDQVSIVRVVLSPAAVEKDLGELLAPHLRPHDP